MVWAHLVGYYLTVTGTGWIPSDVVTFLVSDPIRIIQDFGWLGVAVFFYISGFVITHAAFRESARAFAVKRLLRIYPPLIAAVLLAVAVGWAFGVPPLRDTGGPVTGWDIVANVTLLNHFVYSHAHILTVAWTLAVEVAFYLLMWALHPLLRRWPWVPPLAILAVCTALCLWLPGQGLEQRIGETMTFVPMLIIGQILYLTVTHRISEWLGLTLGLAAWSTFVICIGAVFPERTTVENSYTSNAAIALFVVVIAVLAEGRLRPSRVLSVIAKRSYSLYLVHGPLGLDILGALFNRTDLPYTLSLALAVLAVAIATEVTYRLVERPSIALGRRLTERWRDRARSDRPEVSEAGGRP